MFISVPGRERLAESVLYLAEIVMTVPSMALFGLLMLALAAIGLSAIGFLPAVIALIVYGQLLILRNTHIAPSPEGPSAHSDQGGDGGVPGGCRHLRDRERRPGAAAKGRSPDHAGDR